MIEEIAIRDLGVIGDAKLVFSKGLTAITGETGAGKTMVLSALGLLLGNRADSATVRLDAEQALVEGRWFLASDSASVVAERIETVLSEAGIPFDGSELILSRSVNREGRSKASANARAIPVTAIAELGEELVVVHGQADQIRLKTAKAQREALDSFAGPELASNLAAYTDCFTRLSSLRKAYDELTSASAGRTARIAELREALADLEQAKPQDGELARISAQIDRLDGIEGLRSAVTASHELLSSSGYDDSADALGLVSAARKQLEALTSRDGKLDSLLERLREIGFQLGDVAAELSGYLADLESDSELSLEQLQQRKSLLVSLARRFGVDGNELPGLVASLSDELLSIDNSAEAVAKLSEQIAEVERDCRAKADVLTSMRLESARALEQEVTAELAGLAMPNARLVVQVDTSPELRLHGQDEVTLLLASFNGAQARPIAKGASGGELSRIMLALEVVLAKGLQTPTFIFDEVDAGVGGEAAIEVGRRLARLAQNAQVIVVTHLAQVAAFADRQLRVLKSHAGDVTSSDVVALEGEPRVAELARMISGLADSESARKNAQELLQLARQSV